MRTYRKPPVFDQPLPKGVTVRVLADGSFRWYACSNARNRKSYLGSFATRCEAQDAVRQFNLAQLGTNEEARLERAFSLIREYPQLWQLRDMPAAEQLAKIHSVPAEVRMAVLAWVPVEDDPIYSVLTRIACQGPTTLDQIANLYGCTREYIRQVEEQGTAKIRRLGYIDHYRDYARSEHRAPLEVIAGGVW